MGSAHRRCGEGLAEEESRRREMASLAEQVLDLSRNAVLVNLRFMEQAYSQLPAKPSGHLVFSTDGESLWYRPEHVLRVYAKEQNALARDVFHAALHCVFQHLYVGEPVIPAYWDLACDIAVEAVISDLDLAATRVHRTLLQEPVIARLKGSGMPLLSAEKIYRHLIEEGVSEDEAEQMRKVFYADDHSIWYGGVTVEEERSRQDQRATEAAPAGEQRAERKSQDRAGTKPDGKNPQDRGHREKSLQGTDPTMEKEMPEEMHEAIGPRYANTVGLDRARERWEKAAYQMGVELESFARMWGAEGSGLTMTLRAVTREKQDYATFLRKFATRNEEIKVNDDEFDYIYYCYGLKLYDRVPLIEPLEYVDEKKVRDFVIAIDTSASTKDDLVHKFVTKTYNILHETSSFSRKMNLYIIQADAEIAEVVHIESKKEFERYIDTMEIKGLGGTDFRPVFEYVDRLVAERKLENLGGLVYFTDGQGTYPEKKPDYDTAFVFVDDAFAEFMVPSWAMKVQLESEDIRKFADE